ncbi:50S ribosomal protein L23 [Thermogemmatispora sp.]|uniref:50S ribosomal protein L23 n=1 Tax=Thermogemmatispora sp. TaxID=1968838 RepID=UPI0035E453D1
MEVTEVLRHGIITEKSVTLQEQRNQYTFKVAPEATKIDVRRAVEQLFNVKVLKVNIINVPGKKRILRRRGAPPRIIRGRRWKKAIVTLQPGQTIEALKA